jgi:AmmeMemoRadiSam system protein B
LESEKDEQKKMKVIIFLISFLFTLTLTSAQGVRPIRDKVGFCWTKPEVEEVVSFLDKDSSKYQKLSSDNLIAGISPHDDYLYAGRVYYPLFKQLRTKEVVIFGVTHGTVRRAMKDPKGVLILDNFNIWQGPLSNVSISPLRERIKKGLSPEEVLVSNKAHTIEHSIEALIPFLQYYNPEIKITPIMITNIGFDKMDKVSDKLVEIISKYIKENHLVLGKDIFFLISNDANHYGKDFNNSPYGLDKKAHDKATSRDGEIIHTYLERKIDREDLLDLTNEIWPNNNKVIPLWCGRYPIVFGLMTVSKIAKSYGKSIHGKLFKYSDSRSEWILPIEDTNLGTTAPVSYEHWCGFFSAGFYLSK